MGERPWARVERVDHCARVAAYYGGGFSVRRASLRAPERAFFSSGGRKRKRAALDALVAQGKFVPLDERVKRGLRAAHDQLLAECSAVELLSRSTSSEDDAQTPLTATLTVRGHTQALYSSGSDRVEVARVLDGANDLEQYQDDDRLVLVPPRASFAAADVRELGAVGITRSFRWIVMDPPWENKSVGRGRRYATFHHTELLNVDVPGVASSEQCVLLIWVTNKPAYTQFLLHEALPQWGFTYHDTWFWLKVCANADLVTPLDSTHRLPFEKVIVAYRAANESVRLELKRMLGDKTRVIASVPLRHSWKPPPESFFPSGEMAVNGDALELFARELRPKWTSIGLEVLKFQDVALFVSSPGASSDANASSSDAISSQPATQDPTS